MTNDDEPQADGPPIPNYPPRTERLYPKDRPHSNLKTLWITLGITLGVVLIVFAGFCVALVASVHG